MNKLAISPLILHYYYACRFNEGVLFFTARLNSRFLDDNPSYLKGWKEIFFYIQLPPTSTHTTEFLTNLPPKPDLPKRYKTEEPFLRNQELVEKQKMYSSILIEEKNLISFGLGARVVDPLDRVIDEFVSPGSPPGRILLPCLLIYAILNFHDLFFHVFLKENSEIMKQAFSQIRAADKATIEEK